MSLQGSSKCLIKGGVPVTVVTSDYPEHHAACSLMSVGLIDFANRMKFSELKVGLLNSCACYMRWGWQHESHQKCAMTLIMYCES